MSYQPGDLVKVTTTFTDSNGSPVDPTTVTFRVEAPNGTITVYVSGTDAQLVKDSTGNYHVNVTAALPGVYPYRFEGTGAYQGADDGSFQVAASPFVPTSPTLIAEVRRLAGATTVDYTADGTTWWTDAQIQRLLDNNRTYASGQPLDWTPEPTLGGGGSISYKRANLNLAGAIAPGVAIGGTADTWKLMSPLGVAAQGTANVDMDGWVTFTQDQTAAISLEFYGWSYDLLAAAADLVDAWASHIKTAFDFKTDDQEFSRSQVLANLLERAASLRRRRPPTTATIMPAEDVGVPDRRPRTPNYRRTYGC